MQGIRVDVDDRAGDIRKKIKKAKEVSPEIIIICSKHGKFKQTANNHLASKGCPNCAGKYKTTEDFIKEAFKEITIDGKQITAIEPKSNYAPLFAAVVLNPKYGYRETKSTSPPPD